MEKGSSSQGERHFSKVQCPFTEVKRKFPGGEGHLPQGTTYFPLKNKMSKFLIETYVLNFFPIIIISY